MDVDMGGSYDNDGARILARKSSTGLSSKTGGSFVDVDITCGLSESKDMYAYPEVPSHLAPEHSWAVKRSLCCVICCLVASPSEPPFYSSLSGSYSKLRDLELVPPPRGGG